MRETSAIDGDREAADYQLGTSASTGKAVVALIVVDRAFGSDVEAEIPDKLRGRQESVAFGGLQGENMRAIPSQKDCES